MEKVVVLNSGGFDSTVLLHYVKDYYPVAEIHSLHFSYGQRSSEEELKWSEYNAKKLGAKIKNITLPKFDWTKSTFYDEIYDYEGQYLEWRNLIFIAYAFSYAEAIGANKVFCAFFKSGSYKDISRAFIHGISAVGNNIEVIAPFSDMELEFKDYLIPFAVAYNIEPGTFHSCDISNIPCGKCIDCVALEPIIKELKINAAQKINIDF